MYERLLKADHKITEAHGMYNAVYRNDVDEDLHEEFMESASDCLDKALHEVRMMMAIIRQQKEAEHGKAEVS